MTDHERGCQGREYTCTCGYDDQKDALIRELVAALDNAVWDEQAHLSQAEAVLAKAKEQGYEP